MATLRNNFRMLRAVRTLGLAGAVVFATAFKRPEPAEFQKNAPEQQQMDDVAVTARL